VLVRRLRRTLGISAGNQHTLSSAVRQYSDRLSLEHRCGGRRFAIPFQKRQRPDRARQRHRRCWSATL